MAEEQIDVHGRVEAIVQAVRARTALAPKVGVILGSGLGGFADGLTERVVLPYAQLPGFPVSSVKGHAGQMVLGLLDGAPVVALQGRVHFYEGFAPWQVALPARVLCRLGISALVVTNAAGGIRPDFVPGDLMRITDHVNLSGFNPLVGPNDDRLGPRFPDMSAAYSPALGEVMEQCAAQTGLRLRQGVYVQLSGPSYETPAEIRMLRTLGADAVGMSTVPEVIVAAHMGVPVAGISCITNFAAGLGQRPLDHAEVAETAERVKDAFAALLRAFLPRIASLKAPGASA
jgi:purine-nucleoside phosphorylase